MNLEMVYCCRMIFLKFYGEGGGGGGAISTSGPGSF